MLLDNYQLFTQLGFISQPFKQYLKDGTKAATHLTNEFPKIAFSVQDAAEYIQRGANSFLMRPTEKIVIFDFDSDLSFKEIPALLPKPFCKVKTHRNEHWYFRYDDVTKWPTGDSEKTKYGLDIQGKKNESMGTAIWMPGSLHPISNQPTEIIEYNDDAPSLTQSDVDKVISHITKYRSKLKMMQAKSALHSKQNTSIEGYLQTRLAGIQWDKGTRYDTFNAEIYYAGCNNFEKYKNDVIASALASGKPQSDIDHEAPKSWANGQRIYLASQYAKTQDSFNFQTLLTEAPENQKEILQETFDNSSKLVWQPTNWQPDYIRQLLNASKLDIRHNVIEAITEYKDYAEPNSMWDSIDNNGFKALFRKKLSDTLHDKSLDKKTGQYSIVKRKMMIPKEDSLQLIEIAARYNSYDKMHDYLLSLPPWDGIKRVPFMFEKCFLLDPDPVNSEFAEIFMQQLVAKQLSKDILFSYLLTLFSAEQGTGKNTFFENMLPDSGLINSGIHVKSDDKETLLALRSTIIGIYDERLSGKKVELDALKQITGTRYHKVVPKYANQPVKIDNRFTIVIACNDMGNGVLPRDDSGYRRFVLISTSNKMRHWHFDKIAEYYENELGYSYEFTKSLFNHHDVINSKHRDAQGKFIFHWWKKYRDQIFAETLESMSETKDAYVLPGDIEELNSERNLQYVQNYNNFEHDAVKDYLGMQAIGHFISSRELMDEFPRINSRLMKEILSDTGQWEYSSKKIAGVTSRGYRRVS